MRVLIDGPEAYPAMLDIIARATRWIHFENYIIRSDAAGSRFAEALMARAREGVRVRVLYDALGSSTTSRKYWRALRTAGAEVRAFHPIQPLDLVANFSRDHRKLVVADGERAVIGGLCIGNEWTGEAADGEMPWRDTAVDLSGPACALIDQAFGQTWKVTGGEIPSGDTTGRVAPRGEAEVRVIRGEPGQGRTYRVTELLAAGSLDRLWITDAYLVAPPRLFQALRDAARDGVDVRLLVPGSSDLPLVRNLSRIGYRGLLRAGVRIFEWEGPMLHAKTIVADGRWSRIGSSNLNHSSLMGNWELDVLIENTGLAEAMEHQFRQDIARSREVTRRAVRAPRRISDALPTALSRENPQVPAPAHHKSVRERRQRAVVALRIVLANARRSIFLPLTIGLIVLGVFFFVLPTTAAYTFGVLCAWLAVSAWREAFRRRADR
ncbi:MAG: phospholipase D-like domain-containing protein [Gemmatimonadales bacterium]